MSKPEFRHPDKFQVLKFREWIRENLPTGKEGFIAEDLDLVIKVFGSNYGLGQAGKFMLCELKFYPTSIGYAQKQLFGTIDKLLRKADPKHKIYRGYYVIQYNNEDWDISEFWINDISVDHETLWAFFQFMYEIDGYVFSS